MFGYTPEVVLNGVIAFIVVVIVVLALALIMHDGWETKNMIIPLIGAIIIATVVSSGHMYNTTKENNRLANLPTEVAKLLNVDVEKVELASVTKSEYDYTLKVDKDLVGVVYDEETNKINYLISNDKYIYERGKK